MSTEVDKHSIEAAEKELLEVGTTPIHDLLAFPDAAAPSLTS